MNSDNEMLDTVAVEKLARIATILILLEYKKACDAFPPFNSCMEGHSVLLEEMDELWDEIKKKDSLRDRKKMLAEATQVAAMALRFMVDVCLSKKETYEEKKV